MQEDLESVLGISSAPRGESPRSVQGDHVAAKLSSRYQDAYLVAKTINGFGAIIKGIGIVSAILISMVSIVLLTDTRLGSPLLSFIGVVIGILVGLFLYLLGVIVAAQGQILKASLDSAVNGSPFLDGTQKAKIMSLI